MIASEARHLGLQSAKMTPIVEDAIEVLHPMAAWTPGMLSDATLPWTFSLTSFQRAASKW